VPLVALLCGKKARLCGTFLQKTIMKQIFTALGAMALLATACKQDGSNYTLKGGDFKLEGNIKGAANEMLIISLAGPDGGKNDSVLLRNGKFSYSAKLNEPVQVRLRLAESQQGNEMQFFADPGKATLSAPKDSLYTGKVEGGYTQTTFETLQEQMKKITTQGQSMYNRFMQAQQAGDTGTMMRIQNEFMGMQTEARNNALRFAYKNTNTILSPYIALMYLADPEGEADMTKLYDSMSAPVKNTFFGKEVGKLVTAGKATAIGATAPNFTQNDAAGKPVNLADFRGKYVLVDFWASWCQPCRRENPNVVKAYDRFKSKNFTILGVSLDQDRDKWLQAIAADKLAWNHVSDLQYWGNAAAVQYNVRSIPANFLLDPNGVIIAKNLRGEELEEKLAGMIQ
jgi:peroxiredoxin